MAVTAHRWLKSFRTLHLYFGVFTAPALLFLAFTGALQSVNLHEATRGSDYKPPAWIVSLSHMHKKQTFDVPVKRGPPRNAAAKPDPVQSIQRPAERPRAEAPRHNPWPMKIFFVLVSLGLMASTLTGLYMSWRSMRNRRRFGAVLVAGIVVPALLMLF